MKPSVKAGIDEENIEDLNILLSALNDLDSGKGNTNEILDIVNIIRKKDRQKERGEYEKVWRVLRWMGTLPGAKAGSWFEFYGPRLAPPFPQVGITPWTWAEMLILFCHHVIGIQPEIRHLRLRPRMLPGIKRIKALFPLRGGRIHLEIKRASKGRPPGFRSSGTIIQSSDEEAIILYSKKDFWVEAFLP